ncbi:PAS domain S-box protein [bacterium]|nr:PAS domain S-box protein [bacterium]
MMKRYEYKSSEFAQKISDVSEKLKSLVWEMMQELRESEQLYRSIVENAEDAIITIAPDSKVTSWNKGACKIFGYEEEEALGRQIDELIARNSVGKEAMNLSHKVLQGESIKSLEALRYDKNGEAKNVLISASPIFNERHEVEAVTLMYKDISELKKAHEQLLRTEKQATLGVIAGSIGHELNNLVSGLLIHARLLQQSSDQPEKVKSIAETFAANLEKVALHGRNLLSLSRPTKPRFEPLDLNAVLDETTETLLLTGVLKYMKVEKKYSQERAYIYGDRNLLEQVIRNLEINAAHAMQPGGHLTLTTRLEKNGEYLLMEFRDTGHGIAEENLKKIFLPFFTTKSEGVGTGLGLPIVKDIVEQHNGHLTLESQVGQGTTITVHLPVAKDVLFTKNLTLS